MSNKRFRKLIMKQSFSSYSRYIFGIACLVASFLLFILSIILQENWQYYLIACFATGLLAVILIGKIPKDSKHYFKYTLILGVSVSILFLTISLLTHKISLIVSVLITLFWAVKILNAKYHFIPVRASRPANESKQEISDLVRVIIGKKPKAHIGRIYGEEEDKNDREQEDIE